MVLTNISSYDYVFEIQQCQWSTCSEQNHPVSSCPYCMHTVWVIGQQVTQTDCALLSIWVHSYVSDITATYCCSALSSPSEHILCSGKLEIFWSRFQKDIFFNFSTEPFKICLKYTMFFLLSTNPMKRQDHQWSEPILQDICILCKHSVYSRSYIPYSSVPQNSVIIKTKTIECSPMRHPVALGDMFFP